MSAALLSGVAAPQYMREGVKFEAERDKRECRAWFVGAPRGNKELYWFMQSGRANIATCSAIFSALKLTMASLLAMISLVE
jgi:hypothetical protein